MTTIVDSCESTNELAKRWIVSGVPHGSWVSAKQQTSGRGRLGRAWSSEVGGLYLSYILRISDKKMWSWVPLAVGVACRRAIAQLGPSVLLKWPNDLMLNDRKLGGILCESQAAIVVGIGINCNAPAQVREVATACVGASPDLVREAVVSELDLFFGDFSSQHVRALQEEFLSASYFPLGSLLSWQQESKAMEGKMAGIGNFGELLVQDKEDRIFRLYSEEVSKVRPADRRDSY